MKSVDQEEAAKIAKNVPRGFRTRFAYCRGCTAPMCGIMDAGVRDYCAGCAEDNEIDGRCPDFIEKMEAARAAVPEFEAWRKRRKFTPQHFYDGNGNGGPKKTPSRKAA